MNVVIRPLLRKILSSWKLAVEILLVAFFLFHAARNWHALDAILGRLSPAGLILCAAIYSVSHFIAGMSTKTLFASLGFPKQYRWLMGIYFRRLPAKYVPGGIWHTVGRGSDYVRAGIPMRQVGQVLALEQLLAIWWSGFLGLLLMTFAFDSRVLIVAFIWIAISALGVWFASRRTNLAMLISVAMNPAIHLVYVAGWACLAAAFSIYVWMGGMAEGSVLRVAASYLVSWMIGALAFFAPQGIGVFEFSMNQMMRSTGYVETDFLWYVASYRVVVLASDLAAWGAALLWQRLTPFVHRARSFP